MEKLLSPPPPTLSKNSVKGPDLRLLLRGAGFLYTGYKKYKPQGIY